MTRYDAVVVGAGPNGLTAAICLAREGWSVLLREANKTVGGAARSAELTLPGLVHDAFSSVYPLGIGSPIFRSFPLERYGLEWAQPPAPLAHPFDDGSAAVLHRSIAATAATLGPDGAAYDGLIRPLVNEWEALVPEILSPLHLPRHPFRLSRFGLKALRSIEGTVRSRFEGDRARALLAGSAAHAALPLDFLATAAYGLVLNAAGHAVGWPFARGGAGKLTEALAAYLLDLGGTLETGAPVRSLAELPEASAVLLDLTPRQLLRVAGERLPAGYREKLEGFRYGPGVFKVDWALSGPVPWTAEACHAAGTVHLVGSFEELRETEGSPYRGRHSERPFVLFAQPSRFDASRTRDGLETAWGYCHVPNGSDVDMTERIEAQVERFAPGFRELIVARSVLPPARLEALDANLVGGDVNGGAGILGQVFFRPTFRLDPYATPLEGLYLCSASTPPGGAVHGMCGYHAARSALKRGRKARFRP